MVQGICDNPACGKKEVFTKPSQMDVWRCFPSKGNTPEEHFCSQACLEAVHPTQVNRHVPHQDGKA